MINIEYKPYSIDTSYLFPPSLGDFLGPNDEVHVFKEVTEHLDISYLDSDFNGMGQHPYHPLMLLRLLMWGMANRVMSTRRIELLTRRDVSYIYLAGNQRPDYRTLARFRRRNAKEIKKLFKQTVLLCARLGMINLGHVALDGTKLKANTSKHKAMSYVRMKGEEERLEREIEELMLKAEETDREEDRFFGEDNNGYNLPEELQRREERLNKIRQLKEELEREKRQEQGLKEEEMPQIEDKEQRSFADRDARMMLMKRGEFDYAYNAQACVDDGHGVIVAAELSNNASDRRHLPGLVKEVRELRGELEKENKDKTVMTADNGYFSIKNIEHEGEGIELLIASGREGKEKRNRQTPLVNRKQIMKAEMRARLKKPENQAIYRRRKWVVEQVIGQIKEGMGFRGVTMRGKLFALAQWLIACAVHNLMKAVRFIAELRKLRTMEVVTEAA